MYYLSFHVDLKGKNKLKTIVTYSTIKEVINNFSNIVPVQEKDKTDQQ